MKSDYNIPVLVFRSTLYWIISIINTVIMGFPVLLSRPFSYAFCTRMTRVWLKINLYALKLTCNVSWQVEGLENLPEKPCLMMAKHQSTWETYYLPTLLPKSVYVAKKSLSYIPIFGWAIIACKFILIDRSSGRSAMSQMVEQAQVRFAEGDSVIVFPEGTRMPVGAEPHYRIGGAKIAEKTGVDIIPVALNAGEFWPRLGYIKWPGVITICIGPAIKTEGKAADVILAETQDWIESRMEKITVLNRFPY